MCKSFVFYEDWLLAAETIEDPVLRGEFLQTIATFALRGEGAECSQVSVGVPVESTPETTKPSFNQYGE